MKMALSTIARVVYNFKLCGEEEEMNFSSALSRSFSISNNVFIIDMDVRIVVLLIKLDDDADAAERNRGIVVVIVVICCIDLTSINFVSVSDRSFTVVNSASRLV